MKPLLRQAADQFSALLPALVELSEPLERVGQAMLDCWSRRGKVLAAGNGGSAADAIHLAEELVVRFMKNRRALAAIALTDGATLTCAGNDLGFEHVFERQVEALGNAGDILCVFSTSGNSPSILRALEIAREQRLLTVGWLGRDGGKAKPLCDISLIVPSDATARIQEGHQLLYHSLCEWIDQRVE